MNKKIIITIASILVVILLGLGLFVLIFFKQRNTNSTSSTSANYSMTITEYDDTISGTLISNGTVTLLDESGVAKNAFVSYNTPRDVLWVACPSGYTLNQPSSASNNKLVVDNTLKGVNMELVKDQQNNINFVCDKN